MGKLVGIKQFCEYVQTIKSALGQKVDKVTGKGLSTNDYTTAEKNKLAGIASGAEVNVQSDWNVTSTTSDAYIKNKPTIPSAATANPLMDGTVAVGSSAKYAREDHRHPTDTSRAPSSHSHAWTEIASSNGTTKVTFSSIANYSEVLVEARFPNQNDSSVSKFFSTVIPKAALSNSTLEVWVGGGKGASSSAAGGAARAVCNVTWTSLQGVNATDATTDRTSVTTWYLRAR